MTENAWRKMRLEDALARPEVRDRARAALDAGPLCDHCLGRLFAGVDTGRSNADRGRIIRTALSAPLPGETCDLCHGLFAGVDAWIPRARAALEGWEFATFAVSSHAEPGITAREEALWQRAGDDLAEPYKQAFNRLLGIRICDVTGWQTNLADPDVILYADHRTGEVTVRIDPLFVRGRYRKLVRGMPQCRWWDWPTSIQQVVGDPICAAAGGEDHAFHGCGREDVDVLCLGERPFVVQVQRPRRRRLDWAALTAEINRSGKVEVVGLEPCRRPEVARLKGLRPDKTYRARVSLGGPVSDEHLERLRGLVGPIQQQTPLRVLKRRTDLMRTRLVKSFTWQAINNHTLEITVRAQAGTYIKELINGNEGRTRPSLALVLGLPAECVELDVLDIHVEE